MPLDPGMLGKLSDQPGVYLFRDTREAVLYVGKAKSLRTRVRSYLRADAARSPRIGELLRHVSSVETLVVGGEAEALILEANLIKAHRPRFNILLRDDKRYPYLKVTVGEPFPRVLVTRRVVDDGSRYFGPYTQVGAVRQAIEAIKRLHAVRSCRFDLPREAPERPCLDHHIGRCRAPCVGLQSREDYRAGIDEIVRVLEGDTEPVRRDVERRMREAARELDFESAARLRDVVRGLDALSDQQRVQRVGGGDLDVVGVARDGDVASGVVLRVRSGVLLGRDAVRFSDVRDEEDRALLASLLARRYLGRGASGAADLPTEVLVPVDAPDRLLLARVLSERAGRSVTIRVPRRGDKVRLVELAAENARHTLEDRIAGAGAGRDRAEAALYSLQEALDLKVVPRSIVCFDVSHTQGSDTVASAVAFENGEPKKAHYRHMRIRHMREGGSWGNDDYRSMAEAVRRFFRRRIEEGGPLPDLAVVDGGRGQLSAAGKALADVGLGDVQVVALAKREEEVFAPGRAGPVRLDRRSRALHLLQRMRDEAHRFAVRYNRKLRTKRTVRSELGEIPGIGPKRQRELLRRFGSVKGVRAATLEEIARLPGFSEVLASRLLTYLGR